MLGTARKQWGSDVSAAPVVNTVSSMGGSGSRVIRGGGRSFGQPAPGLDSRRCPPYWLPTRTDSDLSPAL